MIYSLAKAAKIFANPENVRELQDLLQQEVKQGKLPALSSQSGRKGFNGDSIGLVGERHGFLPKLKSPKVISVFITKGGVLKTTLTLNLARLAALHGIKTIVVGLDLQGDVTTALGCGLPDEPESDLKSVFASLDATQGLSNYLEGDAGLFDIVQHTDLKNLDLIPETPELVKLDQHLLMRARREYWLLESVVVPLKKKYDLILLDGSPNWNQLITNALVAADLVLSPVECKINNYRNLQMFRALIQQFKKDMHLDFKHIFLPTRLNPQRRLSQDIFSWYQNHLENCLPGAIRESVQGEEASALHLSLSEHAPGQMVTEEMRDLIRGLWTHLRAEAPANKSLANGRESSTWL